ncbi:MAG: cupin domain-containing protein [Clostridia bacterium]|nr:cupin domain-containing protein [Clostridia bacterium]
MVNDIGSKLKQLRTMKELTLKDLSAKTNLSIGFLSQIERGVTSVAISSLDVIAKALDTDLSYFFTMPKKRERQVLRSFEQEVFTIKNSQFIDYHLTLNPEEMEILPRLQIILPQGDDDGNEPYGHEGEEFIYVLEGILTVNLDNQIYQLYPGDSMHYNSSTPHNWNNNTSKNVKILIISTPNRFKK